MIYPKSQSRYIKWQFWVVNPGKPDPKGLGLPVAQLLSLLNPTHAPASPSWSSHISCPHCPQACLQVEPAAIGKLSEAHIGRPWADGWTS